MSSWRFSLLGYPLGWVEPLFLIAAVLVFLLGFGLAVRELTRKRNLAGLASPRHRERLAPGVSNRRPALRAAFTTLALVCFCLALARPQCGSHSELTKKRGIDLVVAIDGSKSMLARDVSPNRLERAKLELNALLDGLKGDRVGIVAFAGSAFVQCPLTSDYSAAKIFLRAIDPLQMPQGGTDVGEALEVSMGVLQSAERGTKDRAVLLLTDGEDLAGEGMAAAKRLADAGIRIFAVAIGSESGEPIPVVDRSGRSVGFQKDESGQPIMSRVDRRGLDALAKASGGEAFYESRGVAVSQVIERIDTLHKSELESRLTIQYAERYQPLVGLGLLFMVAAALVFPSWRRA